MKTQALACEELNRATRFEINGGHEVIVDVADLPEISHFRWALQGSRPNNQYAVARTPDGKLRMHRLIAGAKPGEIVDHINGDRLDNRRENLRITDAKGNSQNAGKRKPNGQSRFKGVCRGARGRNWRASIRQDGRTRFVGQFKTEEDAARAYDVAAAALHGSFAKTNVDLGLLPPLT